MEPADVEPRQLDEAVIFSRGGTPGAAPHYLTRHTAAGSKEAKMTIAIIGGTGFTEMRYLESPRAQVVRTPFGGMTAYFGGYQGRELIFLPRHGLDHNLLSHQVNYQANI